MEELEYITQKALMKCSDGGAPGLFTPSYNTTVKINGCVVATAMDDKPMSNIPTFVICAKTQKPCMPVATMWQDTYSVKVKSQQTLLGKSCMQCGIGGKIEFLTSGQIPLSAAEEGEVKDMRDDVQKTYDEEQKEANKPWWQKAGEFALDMVPIVGPIVSLAKNVSEGNFGMAALDVGFLALDVVGLVATPFTGGASLAASTAAKAGLRATIKGAVKATAKKMSKEAIKAGAERAGKLISKLTVKSLTKGKLCVFACFPAGTPVAVKGGYTNIEDIQAGDEVWAWDEASGELALKKVVSTLQRDVHALVELSIEGETIYATPEHPFFVDGKWKEAGLLEVSDQVQLFISKQAKVESVRFTHEYAEAEVLHVDEAHELLDIGSVEDAENTTVYNLQVEDLGTYFVGWIKALVHNNAETKCLRAGLKKLYKELGEKFACFPAGTLVHTSTGNVEIEQIQVGDFVWAYDIIEKEKVLKQVTATYTNFADTLINIILSNGAAIKATKAHRFWVPEKQAWIEAEKLRIGMRLLCGQIEIEIRKTELLETELQPTYNFEVEDLHNYFVGACNILVHNAGESIFASLVKCNSEIYGIYDNVTEQIVYVGKTVQTNAERLAQHAAEKGLDLNRFDIRTLDDGNWTAYETAVKEQHFIKKHGTQIPKLTDEFAHVFNKINAVTERKFIKYFGLHKLC